MSSAPITRTLPERLRTWLATPTGLLTLFVVGLGIRLIVAPADGFPTDMSAFKAWAGRLAERGPWNFYPRGGEEYFVDYPPGYLYVLWGVGIIGRIFGGLSDFLVKLPPILCDLGVAWIVGTGAERIAPVAVTRRMPVKAVAAATILLNPAIIFVSAVWGQADSWVTLLVAGSLVLLGTKTPTFRREAAGIALLAWAFGSKPQAMFVIPVVLLVLCWRHIRVRMDEVGEEELRREARGAGFLRVLALGMSGVVFGFLLFAPFRMFPGRAFEFYREASQTYRVTSVFAFNLWGAVGFWRADTGKDAVQLLGIDVVWWGIVLFCGLGTLVLARAWAALRHGVEQGRVLAFGSVAMTLVGFAVVTRIHERYLFLPIALSALLVSHRFFRRMLAALSFFYLVNVYFPYVYYLEREGLSPSRLLGAFDGLYGSDIGSVQMKLLSVAITGVCLIIAFAGWRALEAPLPKEIESDDTPPAEPEEPREWTFELHPVGRLGALIALGVFALALLSRLAGLGHPPGMFFDEVYHARTGAEYLGGKEVFEYTHPPFAKEVMGFSTQHLSGLSVTDNDSSLDGIVPTTLIPKRGGVAWARETGDGSAVVLGAVDDSCGLRQRRTLAQIDVRAEAMVSGTSSVFVAGEGADGPVLLRIDDDGDEMWRAPMPGDVRDLTQINDRAYVVTTVGDLVTVSPEGEPKTLVVGASAVAASSDRVWAAFPDDRQIASWDSESKRDAVIETGTPPHAITVPHNVERVYVATGDDIVSYDTESKSEHARIRGTRADLLGAVPEQTSVWAVGERDARIIEPHSGVVIGSIGLPDEPTALSADQGDHRLLAIDGDGVSCIAAHPQFAWRLGSAITGAAMIAFAFLIALRLFGSRLGALLAAMFLTVCGLAFTIARIAMNDSYMTAFVLGAWFCALSALRSSGRRASTDGLDPPAQRASSIMWLLAGGVFAGFGLASKWPALYAIAGIGLLFLWDGFNRRERSIWRIAGRFVPSIAVLALAFGVVPLGIYVVTYIPYFLLGHDIGDFFSLQKSMFDYHATLTASHPFGSPWYGWPIGYRAVFLYLSGQGDSRSEIWTLPNLVVFWGGLVAIAATIRDAAKSRRAALAVVILGAAVQYVPWMAVSRVTFMYHYLPVVPWLAIALGWFLVDGLRGFKYRKAVMISVSAAAVAVFAVIYPILVGWDMPVWYLDLMRDVFSWVI